MLAHPESRGGSQNSLSTDRVIQSPVGEDYILTLLRLASAIGVLWYASVLDWRTRRVPNPLWILLSLVGMVLIGVQVIADEAQLGFALVLIPIGVILTDVYLDTEDSRRGTLISWSKYAVAVASILVLGYTFIDHAYFQHLMAVPVMMLVIVALYFFDVIRGGADAKALLSLSILFPFYPSFGGFPVIDQTWTPTFDVLFPFAFVVLFTAAIIVAFAPLGFLAINISRREYRFPQAFLGYRMNHEDLKGRHYWLMERMEDGQHVFYSRPRQEEDLDSEVERLVRAGHTRLWVTAKIPFIIPMLAGVIVSTVFGNVFFLITSL